MIWLWVTAGVAAALAGVGVWLHRRRRLGQLLRAARALVRARADLEYRQETQAAQEGRYEADSALATRKTEQDLLQEVSHGDRTDLVDRINRGRR